MKSLSVNPISRYRVILGPVQSFVPEEINCSKVSQDELSARDNGEIYQEGQEDCSVPFFSASINGEKLSLHLSFPMGSHGRQEVLERLMNIHDEFVCKYDWLVQIDSEVAPPLGLFGILFEVKKELEKKGKSLKLVLRGIDKYSDAYLLRVLSNFETTLE